jgi:hypothetical protein
VERTLDDTMLFAVDFGDPEVDQGLSRARDLEFLLRDIKGEKLRKTYWLALRSKLKKKRTESLVGGRACGKQAGRAD